MEGSKASEDNRMSSLANMALSPPYWVVRNWAVYKVSLNLYLREIYVNATTPKE